MKSVCSEGCDAVITPNMRRCPSCGNNTFRPQLEKSDKAVKIIAQIFVSLLFVFGIWSFSRPALSFVSTAYVRGIDAAINPLSPGFHDVAWKIGTESFPYGMDPLFAQRLMDAAYAQIKTVGDETMFAQMGKLVELDATDRALRRTCTATGEAMSQNIEKEEVGYVNTIHRQLGIRPMRQEDLYLIVIEHERGGRIDGPHEVSTCGNK